LYADKIIARFILFVIFSIVDYKDINEKILSKFRLVMKLSCFISRRKR